MTRYGKSVSRRSNNNIHVHRIALLGKTTGTFSTDIDLDFAWCDYTETGTHTHDDG